MSRSASWQESSSLTLSVACTLVGLLCDAPLWDSAQAVDEQSGPSAWPVSRLESPARLKRRLAGVPCTVSVSCLQSIQHAADACNGFLWVTLSGRILENADFHKGWWVHSAPCSTGGRGWGFAAVLPLADKTKKKKKTPGHQHNASMSLISLIHPLTSRCACTEVFLQRPRSRLGSE